MKTNAKLKDLLDMMSRLPLSDDESEGLKVTFLANDSPLAADGKIVFDLQDVRLVDGSVVIDFVEGVEV